MFFFLKILFAAIVIAFASWLSGKKPELSGFLIALPLASLMALIFSYLEHKNPETSITFAKSILVGVPVSYLFFLPFNVANPRRPTRRMKRRMTFPLGWRTS